MKDPKARKFNSKDKLPTSYLDTLNKIKQRINEAQYEALRAVNRELIMLY